MSKQTVWMVKAPDKCLMWWTASQERYRAMESFRQDRMEIKAETATMSWKHWYRRGYRCVRVELKEF